MKKIFYAIDMGSPSESGGFFCWRYCLNTHECTPYKGAEGWLNCIKDITNDVFMSEIHLTIEAPLWGSKRRDGQKFWGPRFYIHKNKNLTEHPWYTLAGAITGFMAQEFLSELSCSILSKEIKIKKKITLRESYISGIKSKVKISKPEPIIKTKISGHADDAFEGLLLTLEANQIPKDDYIFNNINKKEIEQWLKYKKTQINFFYESKDYETFPLGLLKNSKYFKFISEDILLTKRRLKI